MLRLYFHESKRVDSGRIAQCNEAIRYFSDRLRYRQRRKLPFTRYYRQELFAQSMLRALDELEQSIYCAQKYGERITGTSEAQLAEAERDDYYRYLYFYKNAIIRIFSTLDKLGYFMNEAFSLQTEKVKPKFSYFTVLRQLRKSGKHPKLEALLSACKQEHGEPMQRLRKKRNVEIHLINAEWLDDLQAMEQQYLEEQRIENVRENMADVHRGFEMVSRSLLCIFRYAGERLEAGKRLDT